MQRVCVYCGSNFGDRPSYKLAAQRLGKELVSHNIGLVYGGGNVGLMGAIADAVLAAGGGVIGVIPRALVEKEIAHTGLSQLRVVESMHERKALMAELSDAFIAMPGGFGTLEEFFEITTWTQLGFHKKACGLLNVDGFYDGLLAFLDQATEEKFVRPDHRAIVLAETDPAALIERLSAYTVPILPKWIGRDEK